MINVYLLLLTGNGLTITQSPRSLRLSLSLSLSRARPGLSARTSACHHAAHEDAMPFLSTLPDRKRVDVAHHLTNSEAAARAHPCPGSRARLA